MEGNENVSKHVFRNARAVISDLQYRFRFAGAYLLEGHIYGRGRRRMSDCIAYYVLDRAAQYLRHTQCRAGIGAHQFHFAAVRARFEIAVSRELLDKNGKSAFRSLSGLDPTL